MLFLLECSSILCSIGKHTTTMSFLIMFLCCMILQSSLGDEEVFLNISQGTLKGLKTTTVFHGMPLYSFKGIPYAKPNIGSNKFRISEPAEGWTGVRDATEFRSFCVQFVPLYLKIDGDDDCLYLNVYTPDLNREAKRAVIVYLYGGAFTFGSGQDILYGPDFLVERDVVLVTFDYRLGVTGFLNTGDINAPGNAGLKDQVVALKWVRDNIINFSGSPTRVTIFGQSSGAVAAQYHLLSPMSQGLFSGVIMNSGSVATSWGLSYTPREDAALLAKFLGIKSKSTADLVQQFSEVSNTRMVLTLYAISLTLNFSAVEWWLMRPSIEIDFGQERFLPGDPWELIKFGKIADVPVITGLVTDEARLFSFVSLLTVFTFAHHCDKFIPLDLKITDSGQRKIVGAALKKFYFHDNTISWNTEESLTRLMTDVGFFHGMALTSKIMNFRMTSPVYQFLFNFNTPFGFYKNILKVQGGVIHGDELGFLFYSSYYKNKPEPGSIIEQKTNEMVEMWTNFAKERNPSATMDVAKVMWKPLGDEDNYLEIGNNLTMKKALWKDRLDLWVGIAKDVLGDYVKLF